MGRQKERKTGGQGDIRQENMKTGRKEDMKTGRKKDRGTRRHKTGRWKDRTTEENKKMSTHKDNLKC